LTRKAVSFIRPKARSPIAGRFVQRAADDQEICLRDDSIEAVDCHAQRLQLGDGDKWIVCNRAQLERLREAHDFAANVTNADQAERAAAQSDAEGLEPLMPGIPTHQPIEWQNPVRKCKDKADHAGGDHTAHTVGVDGEQDALRRQGGDIAMVVADPEARDDAGARVGPERGRGQRRRAEADAVICCEIALCNVRSAVAEPFPLECGILFQHAQCGRIKVRLPGSRHDIAGKADAEFCHHSAIVMPPSTISTWPLQNEEASEAK
jgi:hypothetical protein